MNIPEDAVTAVARAIYAAQYLDPFEGQGSEGQAEFLEQARAALEAAAPFIAAQALRDEAAHFAEVESHNPSNDLRFVVHSIHSRANQIANG